MRLALNLLAGLAAVLVAAGPLASRAGSTGYRTEQEQMQLPEGVPEIEQAIERFRRREFDPCLALLRSAVQKRPDLFPARLLFAKLCLLQDQPALGRAALEQAVVETPGLPETYLVFGRLALQDGRLADAQLQYDRAAVLAASGTWAEDLRRTFQVDARAGLATVAERRRDWPAAAAALASWLALDPKDGKARQRLGGALFRQGQRDKAHTEFQQASKDDPALEPAAVLMGRLFAEEGNVTKAAEWMEHAVKLAPDDPRSRRAYAAWLLEQDRADQARIQAEAAARIDPGAVETRGLLALIAWQLKDYEGAERIAQALHVESPAHFTASNLWALALAEQPDDAKRLRALQLAQVNARLAPNSGEALTTLGRACFKLGRLDEAEKALRAALTGGTASSETAYYLARVLSARGRTEEITRWLKMSLDAPGRFAFRAEAREWLEDLTAKEVIPREAK